MSGLPAYIRVGISAFACLIAFALPATASAEHGTSGSGDPYSTSGGASPDDPQFKPTGKATLLPNGMAIAPDDAPPEVKAIIEAGNKIATAPYIYGGGHNARFAGPGYDCSGSVSFALHGGGLLDSPLASPGFFDWGEKGPGRWITIYTNAGHMWMQVAGLRFDTSSRTPIAASARKASKRGRRAARVLTSRWSAKLRPAAPYKVRHPAGF